MTDCNKVFPNKLFIFINTRIKGARKIKYVPSMSIPKEGGSTVYIDPFVALDKSIIENVEIPQNYKNIMERKKKESQTQIKNDETYQKSVLQYQSLLKEKIKQQFFVKRDFDKMIEKALKNGEEDLSEELDDLDEKIEEDQKKRRVNNADVIYRKRILDKISQVEKKNIRLTLDSLFSKGNHFFLNKNKYAIFDYTWTNSSSIQKQNIQNVSRNPFLQQYNTRTVTGKKNSLIEDYVYYLNYFWRKYYDSVDDNYPVYRNLDEFYKKENIRNGKRYSSSDWVEAKRILNSAPQNVRYVIAKRNMGIRRLYSDRNYHPRVTQDMFQKIVELDKYNKLKLYNGTRMIGGSSTSGFDSCYYIVIIDLEIFPKEEITPLDEIRLSCDMKKIEIKKAFNELIGRKPEEPPLLSLYGIKDYKKSRKERDVLRAKRYQGQTSTNNYYTQRRLPQARILPQTVRRFSQTRRTNPIGRRIFPQTRRIQYARPIRRGGGSHDLEEEFDDDLDYENKNENDYEKERSFIE